MSELSTSGGIEGYGACDGEAVPHQWRHGQADRAVRVPTGARRSPSGDFSERNSRATSTRTVMPDTTIFRNKLRW